MGRCAPPLQALGRSPGYWAGARAWEGEGRKRPPPPPRPTHPLFARVPHEGPFLEAASRGGSAIGVGTPLDILAPVLPGRLSSTVADGPGRRRRAPGSSLPRERGGLAHPQPRISGRAQARSRLRSALGCPVGIGGAHRREGRGHGLARKRACPCVARPLRPAGRLACAPTRTVR